MHRRPSVLKRDIVVLLVCAGATAASACGDDTAPPATTEELDWVIRGVSEHFEYRTKPIEGLACPGLLNRLEKHFSVVQAYLGFTPTTEKVVYYKFKDADEPHLREQCVRSACALGASVWSYQGLHPHELVHAYLATVGTPPAIFQEGVAVALSCDLVNDAMPTMDWREAVLSNDPLGQPAIYDTGSRLVSYLLRRFGATAFLRLYASLPHYASPSEVDEAMTATYGLSAEQLWQSALAASPGCLPIWSCAGEAAVADGSPEPAGESCGAEEDYRTFTSPTGGNAVLSISPGTSVWAGSCDDRFELPWLGREEFLDPTVGHLAAVGLAPGKHFLGFTGRASAVSIRRPPFPVAGPECQALQPLTVAAGEYPAIHVMIPPGQADWQVKLSLEGPRLLAVVLPSDIRLSVCRDCDPAGATCASVDPSQRYVSVVWSGDYVLGFERQGDRTAPARIDIVGR